MNSEVITFQPRPQAPEGWVSICRGMRRHYVRHARAICGGTLYLGAGPFERRFPVMERETCALCSAALKREQGQ
jgi:hypothetical protein